MRKTKIVCTLGPSTDKEEVLRQLMLEGMAVARMNFSHGSHEEKKARLDAVKRLRKELDLPVAALLDTKGPEIRIGEVEGGRISFQVMQFSIFGGRTSRNGVLYSLRRQGGLPENVAESNAA